MTNKDNEKTDTEMEQNDNHGQNNLTQQLINLKWCYVITWGKNCNIKRWSKMCTAIL